MVPLTVKVPPVLRVPPAAMVRTAPELTVTERTLVIEVLIVGWFPPLGMITSSKAPGTLAGLQFVEVAQAVLVAPVQVSIPV